MVFAGNAYCWNTSLIHFPINFYRHLWLQFDFHEIITELILVRILISIDLSLCLVLVSPNSPKWCQRREDCSRRYGADYLNTVKTIFPGMRATYCRFVSCLVKDGDSHCLKWSICYLTPGILISWNDQAIRGCGRFVGWKSEMHLETTLLVCPNVKLWDHLSFVGIFFLYLPWESQGYWRHQSLKRNVINTLWRTFKSLSIPLFLS